MVKSHFLVNFCLANDLYAVKEEEICGVDADGNRGMIQFVLDFKDDFTYSIVILGAAVCKSRISGGGQTYGLTVCTTAVHVVYKVSLLNNSIDIAPAVIAFL